MRKVVAVAFYIPRDKAKMFWFLHIITIYSDSEESGVCQADIECSFVLYFSNDKWFLNNFSCVYRHLHIFSRKRQGHLSPLPKLELSGLLFFTVIVGGIRSWDVARATHCMSCATSTDRHPAEESENTGGAGGMAQSVEYLQSTCSTAWVQFSVPVEKPG